VKSSESEQDFSQSSEKMKIKSLPGLRDCVSVTVKCVLLLKPVGHTGRISLQSVQGMTDLPLGMQLRDPHMCVCLAHVLLIDPPAMFDRRFIVSLFSHTRLHCTYTIRGKHGSKVGRKG